MRIRDWSSDVCSSDLAAPLVLMAGAVGVSAHADRQRQQAIEHITDLLDQLHEDALDDERSDLDGCADAIDKATTILLDKGRLGVSLGLDSAAHGIGKETATANRRLARCKSAMDSIPEGDRKSAGSGKRRSDRVDLGGCV